MAKNVEVLPGITEISGYTVKVAPIKHPDLEVKAISPTAYHEARHAVAAFATGTYVIELTIESGSGYYGRVILAEPNNVAAMAPEAFRCSGTAFDRWTVIRQGRNPKVFSSIARSVLSDKKKEVDAVASLAQARGTVSGHEIKWAIEEINNPKAKVEVTNPLGEKRHYTEKLSNPSLRIALSLN